jgi:sulfate adenylyltransferase subunit 1
MVVDRGENLPWYEGPALMELLENIDIDHDLNLGDFRFPVQWICRPGTDEHHDFRGYMGRVESGAITVGDPVTVLPSGRSSRVKQILTLEGELKRAFAPQSVTLLLEDDIDISRGDMIVRSGDQVTVAKQFDADICWLSEQPLNLRRKYTIKHTTKTAKAFIAQIQYRVDVNTLRHINGISELQMNDIARVDVKVQQPFVVDSYVRNRATGSFIVIDEGTHSTVAAGMIV